MRNKKSLVSLLLVFSMLMGLLVPVSAASANDEPVLTVTPSVTEFNAGAGTAKVIYTITLNPAAHKITAFSFTLTAPEGMTLATELLFDKGAAGGYWEAYDELYYNNRTNKDGIFTTFEYNPTTGYFGASGGIKDERVLAVTADIMTIEATVDISVARVYTLGVTGFKCYTDGSTSAGGATSVGNVTIKAAPVAVSSITLDKTTLALVAGGSDTLTATVVPENATEKTVTWSSSDATVATVDQTGKVTAVKGGTATITAAAGGKSATCAVTVTQPVTGVTLDKASAELVLGGTDAQKTVTLTATVSPENATDKTVTWTSSDAAVATVDNGVVTAVKAGTATITAKAGDKTATCAISVTQLVTSVSVTSTAGTSVEKTKTLQLVATVLPEDAKDKTVTWSSSNEAIATVDQSGLVTAKEIGKVTITASAKDNSGKSGSIEIEVVPQVIPATGIVVEPETLTLKKGEESALTATIAPANSTDKVEWTSSDPAVATVDSTGKITAVGKGTATITAKAGAYTDTCAVTVTVPVSGVKLDKTTASVDEGATVALNATVEPADANNQTVTWTSSNTEIAAVDASGVVTGVKPGKATITVTTADGGYTATCEVTVACKHLVSQDKIDGQYLKSAADCQNYAVYYKSCVECGAKLEGTFEDTSGSGNHNYTKESGVIAVTATNCQQVTTYWYACSVDGCTANAKDDANAQDKYYHKGEIGAHVYDLTQWGYKAADGHAHACIYGCDAHDELQAHVPGPEATEEAAQLCTVCGYEIAPVLEPPIDENMIMMLLMMMNKKYEVTAETTEGGSIIALDGNKVKFNKSASFKIVAADGYVLSDVLVDGKSVGAVSEYTIKNVRKNHAIKAVFEKAPWVNPYKDVKESDWFYNAVKFVSENNLMNGTDAAGKVFDPSVVCNRSMLVTMLWRLEGSPVVSAKVKFSDVKADAWYAGAVNWASANGIVEGNGDNKYAPDQELTYEQAALILYRYAAYKGVIEGTATAKSTKLTCSDWAKDAVIWAEANGMLKDMGTEIKDMTKSIQRAEIASMLKAFCEGILVK